MDRFEQLPQSIAHMKNQPLLMTIGHSTLALEVFLKALRDNDIKTLVDVRAFPGSRRHPQFGREALAQSLKATGVAYQWMPALGGRRKANAESENGGWQSESFRGYADYMQTPEFAAGLNELVQLSQGARLAYMCSEAVPWRCHRSLISDALMAHGIGVEHIFVKASGESERRPHSMTSFAQVTPTPAGPQITYPAEQPRIPFSIKAS